eukprot:scaffold79083_cov32-Phaeocystis_antarctica.AAC.1
MRAVVTGSRCPHRYGAIVRRCVEKTTQNHRSSVAGAISGEAMCLTRPSDDWFHRLLRQPGVRATAA